MTADLAALAQEAHEKTCPHFQATRGNVDKLDHGLGGGRAVAVNSVIGPASRPWPKRNAIEFVSASAM